MRVSDPEDENTLRELLCELQTWARRYAGPRTGIGSEIHLDPALSPSAAKQLDKLSTLALEQLADDDPSLDATDGAHPAWWRGHDHGVAAALGMVERVIAGERITGAQERLQGVLNAIYGDRQALSALYEQWSSASNQLAALRWQVEHEGCAEAERSDTTSSCDPADPCGLCRLRRRDIATLGE
jgi:hypothetical protein